MGWEERKGRQERGAPRRDPIRSSSLNKLIRIILGIRSSARLCNCRSADRSDYYNESHYVFSSRLRRHHRLLEKVGALVVPLGSAHRVQDINIYCARQF